MEFYSRPRPHLKTELKKSTLWITLHNPDKANAISLEMVASLTEVLRHADFDPQVRVAVIRGEGAFFSAGGDVKEMQSQSGMFAGEANELRMRYIHGIQQIPKCLEDLSLPLIAMVNGAAIGAGCDLAMMCDIRIGSDEARLGETFAKMGLIPGDGGAFFLQRVIGFARAMEISLTCEILSAQKAQQWGMLNAVVSEAELETTVQEWADKIAANAPIAVQMTKKAIKAAYPGDLSRALDLAAAYQGIAQRTDDHVEAVEAFLAKRPSIFKGR